MLDARVARRAGVVARWLGDDEGGVLLHVDSGQYHGLNRTAWVLWTLIEQPRTVNEIVAEFRARVEDPPSDLEREIVAFLDALRVRNLIDIVAS